MFVRKSRPDRRRAARFLRRRQGLHSHFLLWSMDQAFIYFVQGTLPEPMDIWRIKPTGGSPEQITHHESRVSHPVFINPRTLVYLATDASGAGPWLYSIDPERRIPHRVSAGIDTYTSLAASADGERLVATRSTTRTTLWRLIKRRRDVRRIGRQSIVAQHGQRLLSAARSRLRVVRVVSGRERHDLEAARRHGNGTVDGAGGTGSSGAPRSIRTDIGSRSRPGRAARRCSMS